MSGRALSCAEALGLADERHDRTLSPEEEEALRAHLATCRACAAAAAAGDRVHAALLAESAPLPHAFFTDAVVARLDRAPGSRGPAGPVPASERWIRGAAALLGTGAVAAVAVLVLPLDAAADSVQALVPPAASIPMPEVPPAVASLVEDASVWLPPWAAALGAAVALGAAALQIALVRRRPGGPRP